jgi:hypothetical protein
MRQFLTIVLVVGAIWLGLKFYNYAKTSVREADQQSQEVDTFDQPAPGKLPGMPASMEASLEQAKRAGPEALAAWLMRNRMTVRDPRRAEIELDYVVLVGPTDRKEARRVLQNLESRIGPDSPLRKKYERLRKTYQ